MSTDLNSIFNVQLSTEDKLSKAKIQLNHNSPFYSYLVEHLHLVESKRVPTMGVTDKGTCYYSKEWVDTLPLSQLIGVLAHEISHLALRHHQRQNHRNILVNGGSLWNIAIDISNNYLLVENSFELPSDGIIPSNGTVEVFGHKVEDIASKSSEEIYEELKAHLKQMVQEGKATVGSSDGVEGDSEGDSSPSAGDKYSVNGGKAGSFDEHLWGDSKPEGGEDGEGEEGKGQVPNSSGKDWDKILAEAYNHAKMIGKTPAGMAREFEELHRGKVNWRSILRRTVASKIPYDMTYRRPNRKYLPHDIYMPSFIGESIKVIVSLDTSGSISAKDISDFMSEVISISKSFSNVEFRVLTHDTHVHDDVKVSTHSIQKLLQMKPRGGGGTSHKPLYEYIQKKRMHREELKLLVSFTDGYSDFPEKKPFVDTIFVLAGGHIPKEQMPKWATTICIE